MIHEYHRVDSERRNITLRGNGRWEWLDDADHIHKLHLEYLSYRLHHSNLSLLPHSIDDKPALISSNGFKSWWIDGKCHRLHGPAIVYEDGVEQWCWYDCVIPTDEIQAMMDRAGLSHNWEGWTDHDKAVWRLFV